MAGSNLGGVLARPVGVTRVWSVGAAALAAVLTACGPDSPGLVGASSLPAGAPERPKVAYALGPVLHLPQAVDVDLRGRVVDLVGPIGSPSGSAGAYLAVVDAGPSATLVRVQPDGVIRTLARGLAQDPVAVHPSGHLVAVEGAEGTARMVLDTATGDVRHLERHAVNQAGRPAGWAGEDVLLTTGDGADVRAVRWTPSTGRSIDLRVGHWNGLYAVSRDGSRVLARQGDGSCTELASPSASTAAWSSCDVGPSRFSADGTRLVSLLPGDLPGPVRVRDTITGRTGVDLAIDSVQVVSLGWEDATHVLAVLVAERGTTVVRCAVSEGRCTTLVRDTATRRDAMVARG